MPQWDIAKIGAIILPNVGGWTAAILSNPRKSDWYNSLKKPKKYTPPDWAFGPVWTALYCGMGYASYVIWKEGAQLPLVFYGTQLAINWSAMPMFVHLESTKYALLNNVLLFSSVALCTYQFFKVNQSAGLLMVPYLMWMSYVTFLGFNIYKINKK